MSFIIGKKCVSTCDTACVEVCPVDCIHGPIDVDGAGAEVKTLDSVEGLQLYKLCCIKDLHFIFWTRI